MLGRGLPPEAAPLVAGRAVAVDEETFDATDGGRGGLLIPEEVVVETDARPFAGEVTVAERDPVDEGGAEVFATRVPEIELAREGFGKPPVAVEPLMLARVGCVGRALVVVVVAREEVDADSEGLEE